MRRTIAGLFLLVLGILRALTVCDQTAVIIVALGASLLIPSDTEQFLSG